MKLRYLAAAGPREARSALKRRIDLNPGKLIESFDAGALTLWTDPQTPIVRSADGKSVLVGLLFDRATGTRLRAFPGAEVGKPLAEDYWGAYALFACSPHEHSIVRDLSGAVTVYCGSSGQLDIYASDAALLEAAWTAPLEPDLEFIRHWLTFPFLRGARTGIRGIREIHPGGFRRAGASREETGQAWSPFAFTGRDRLITEFDEAADALRAELLRTISSLGHASGEIAVQLSGGLDSSIVAAALGAAGLGFRALTFATAGPDGDERRFARQIAQRCGVELVELVEGPGRPIVETGPGKVPRPPPNPLLQPLHRAISLQVAQLGADVVLDGAGGDNVFAALNTGAPALDALRHAGPAAASRALREIAQVHGCTFWSAARSALRRARRGAPARWPRDTTFLAENAAADLPEPHPWLEPQPGLLPGSADHLRMIVGIHHFLPDPQPMAPATFHPLLAQPVLELCLRIPSWLWVSGARDRAVARQAFRGLVPDAILDRRGKGTLESMFVRGYRQSRPALERLLADGELAGRGIIDGASVRAYLKREREPRDLGYVRILEIAAAEQWLRSFGA